MNAALVLLACGWVEPRPANAEPPVEAARKALAAIVTAAQANAAKPEAARKEGDALTELYVRAAAGAAADLARDQAAGAFLLALGVGLDDSPLLRRNPVTARLCGRIESEAERQTRLKVLGKPTMRGRRDWAQHFAVSCFLAEQVGPALAETAGVLKEQLDAQPGGSGFSFADLSANLAGIELARRIKGADGSLRRLAAGFTVNASLPDARGLREGLSAQDFEKDYGSIDDERFKAEVAAIRKRIAQLPANRQGGDWR